MKKLAIVILALGALTASAPAFAQQFNVRIGTGYDRIGGIYRHDDMYRHDRYNRVMLAHRENHWNRGLHRGWERSNDGARRHNSW